jgi:hypothetical protein
MGRARCQRDTGHSSPALRASRNTGSRTIKVLFDLITIKFLSSYLTKPLYLFGTAGVVCLLISLLTFALSLYYRFVEGVHLNRMPLATLSMIMFAMGVQFIFMGLLAEMIVRTYHESQGKPTYLVRERINIEGESDGPRNNDERSDRGDGATGDGRRSSRRLPLPISPSPLADCRNTVANLSQDQAVDAIDTLISEGGSHYGA